MKLAGNEIKRPCAEPSPFQALNKIEFGEVAALIKNSSYNYIYGM